jgi:hypothetical protein
MVLLVWSEDSSEVVASPLILTFTSQTWDRPQTVTVTGVDDLDVDGDQRTDVSVSVASTPSGRDTTRPHLRVEVTNADDDIAGVGVTASRLGTSIARR